MANGNSNNPKDGIKHLALIFYLCGAFVSGAGGNYLVMRNVTPEVVAPDRFTGTEAKELKKRLDAIELADLQLRRDMDRLPPRELTERVLRIELQVQQLRLDFDRCCKAN